MDAEERPKKLRKLSHGSHDDEVGSVRSEEPRATSAVCERQSEHSEDQESENATLRAAALADELREGEGAGNFVSSLDVPDIEQISPPLSKIQLKKLRRRDEW